MPSIDQVKIDITPGLTEVFLTLLNTCDYFANKNILYEMYKRILGLGLEESMIFNDVITDLTVDIDFIEYVRTILLISHPVDSIMLTFLLFLTKRYEYGVILVNNIGAYCNHHRKRFSNDLLQKWLIQLTIDGVSSAYELLIIYNLNYGEKISFRIWYENNRKFRLNFKNNIIDYNYLLDVYRTDKLITKRFNHIKDNEFDKISEGYKIWFNELKRIGIRDYCLYDKYRLWKYVGNHN